jgi:tetratricopeptide (TPR) repeat protein
MLIADQALQHLKGTQKPMERRQLDEYLWIIDSQIAIYFKGDETKQVLDKLRLRMELVSRWRSDEVLELTKELQRMACFYSIKGEHNECKHLLEHALSVITSVECVDWALELDVTKLLAVTHDCLGQIDKAIKFYSRALGIERQVERTSAARTCCALLNAISYCYLLSGDCDVALANVEESARSQKNMPNDQAKNLLYAETMILYGNILAAKNSLSQAAFYYDSAISSNPNKSPLESTNLRAWYNKGVTQFRSGDIVGSGHSFGVILDAIEGNSNYVSPDVSYVLNAIGNIHFSNKMYAKA